MKIKAFFILFIVSFIVLPHAHTKIYILGYPKSGNNLLCYSLANILDKSVLLGQKVFFSPNPLGNVSKWKLKKIGEVFSDAISFEHHSAGLELHKANQINDYLVIIVRDYRECFIRSCLEGKNAELLFKPEQVLAKFRRLRSLDSIPNCYATGAIDYINILRCYDEWNPQTRVLVYYEDLVTDFESTMETCLKELNINIQDSLFNEFLIQKQERLEESRKNYRFGKTMSGNDTKHHQKKWLSLGIAEQIDREMVIKFPYFWHKYLSRYQFKP